MGKGQEEEEDEAKDSKYKTGDVAEHLPVESGTWGWICHVDGRAGSTMDDEFSRGREMVVVMSEYSATMQ